MHHHWYAVVREKLKHKKKRILIKCKTTYIFFFKGFICTQRISTQSLHQGVSIVPVTDFYVRGEVHVLCYQEGVFLGTVMQ